MNELIRSSTFTFFPGKHDSLNPPSVLLLPQGGTISKANTFKINYDIMWADVEIDV